MPHSITCSTKILTLTINPFLFMFVGIIHEFSMVPGVYILYCPLRKKMFTFLSESTNVRIQQHIHHYIMLLYQDCCWIGKNTDKKFSCVMVLMVRPSSTLKFQFIFSFNEFLWEIFSLLNFETCWFYIWIVGVYLWLLIIRHKWLQSHPLNPMPMNKKPEFKDHQYILRNVEKDL